MPMYLVQYGKWGSGKILEANNPYDAVDKVINDIHFFKNDTKSDFKVFLIDKGEVFRINSSYEIRKV